jgi:hypothetical protein
MLSRVVNQYAAHEFGGDGEKVCAILEVYLTLINEPQVGLVNERAGLQGVSLTVATLAAHVAVGQAMQFVINDPDQLIVSRTIAIAPVQEQFSNFLR